MDAARHDITVLLEAARHGDARAADQLFPLLYDELREVARRRLAAEAPGRTLQATALVHDAYLRLVGDGGGGDWHNRAHFFGAAARAMRQILVDRARGRRAIKRGGDRGRVELEMAELSAGDEGPVDVLALDDALDRLQARDPRKWEVVMLRYFAGLTIEHTARALGLGVTTVKEEWQFAKAWLHGEMTRDAG